MVSLSEAKQASGNMTRKDFKTGSGRNAPGPADPFFETLARPENRIPETRIGDFSKGRVFVFRAVR
jgi:hypothetical protein